MTASCPLVSSAVAAQRIQVLSIQMVSPVRAPGSSVTAVTPLANILPCAVCWLFLDTAQDSMSKERSSARGGADHDLVCHPRPAGPAGPDLLRACPGHAADQPPRVGPRR